MSWFSLGTVISRGDRLLERFGDGARPIKTGRSTSAVEPSEARSTARTGPATNCGTLLPSGLPHTRQLMEFGGLACRFWHSTAKIAESWIPSSGEGTEVGPVSTGSAAASDAESAAVSTGAAASL